MSFSLSDHLRQLAYFEGQNPAIIERMVSSAVSRAAAGGETLFLEGEAAAGLWMIQTGRVKIYKLNPQGQEHILRIFGDHDTFNDISAFDGGANPANAAALSDTQLWVFSSQIFQECIQADGRFALQWFKSSGRVRGLIRQIEDLTLYSVTVRVARLLLNQVADPRSAAQVSRASHSRTSLQPCKRSAQRYAKSK